MCRDSTAPPASLPPARLRSAQARLERLVSAVLVEIDDKWAADSKAHMNWECQDA